MFHFKFDVLQVQIPNHLGTLNREIRLRRRLGRLGMKIKIGGDSNRVSLRVQVPSNHILIENLY